MKFRSIVIGVTGTVSVLVSHVSSLDYNPLTDFCRRFYHQTATIKNRIYIDGGFVGLPENPNNYTNNRLLFHDLNDDSLKIPPLITNLTYKPNNVPSVVGGQLWADQANEKLYLFGGEYSSSPPYSPTLWTYDPWNDTWSEVKSEDREQRIQRPSFGAGLSVENLGMGYYLGGWLGPKNVIGWQGDRIATSNLISYDMIGNTFRNDTGPLGPPRVEGTLQYVPTGDQGLLVSFGGLYAEAGKEPVGASMSDIDVYDVSAKVWHRVQASGDIPTSRRLFCGGLSSAADSSSHNIYIYGGASTSKNSSGSDDIYILTMPSFIWVKFWVHDPPRAHNGFSCNVINKGQMMVLGGTFPFEPTGCDAPTAWGAHIMDLGRANPDSAEWYGYRKNLTTYSVPQDLIKVIGGGPTGGATLVAPQGGFNSSDLKTLFSRTLAIGPRQPTRTPLSDNTDGPPLAVIVGPSVGLGIPAIAAMLGFYLIYTKRQAQKAKINKEKHDLHLNTERIQAYQLPTTQSPVHSPGDSTPGYQYPIHPYTLAQNQSKQAAFQPYLYQPPHLCGYPLAPGITTQPQELPAGRPSNSFERLARESKNGDDDDDSKDTLREFYGKNPFEETSRLEKPRDIKIGEERDWRGEEKPLPSPNRRRIYNKEDKPLPEYPKWDPKRKETDPGPMPGKDALGRMF